MGWTSRRPSHYSPSTLLFASVRWLWFLIALSSSIGGGQAQTQANTTDPSEVAALNSIFSSWKISSSTSIIPWNISGDPCSGAAINSTSLADEKFNPGILCNCSLDVSMCHITELKVAGLLNQGNIPNEIGGLKELTGLNLSRNLLSGTIPMELGRLQNLISLDLSINSFNGSLPKELGNLVKLQHLRLESLRVGGDIPAEFAGLKNLQTLWISDNNFTGRIPDFIGSLTELTDLRLQGNSFLGPIPPGFANLTKLTQLRIGDLLSGTSMLTFIGALTSLEILVVRNSFISGTIPSLGNYKNLEHLDLSFNNLTGSLPEDLFTIPSLEFLFLGNNSLSGSLPLNKSTKLVNIDLSYNELSGKFPPWVNERTLKLNLVANNFIFDKSNDSVLPFGLKCLQKNFPCSHESVSAYDGFAVNCGAGAGSTAVVMDGQRFETENTLDQPTATYYITTEQKWGFSSVGRFFDTSYINYIQSIGSRFPNTQNSELFQDSRLSPSSLRYYGINLHNGNYTVSLMFGETDNWNAKKGRRLFDIFIQGTRVEKDFDITSHANGLVLSAVTMSYTAVVTKNFLEIHFFWAGKGTCCIPSPGSYGPSISAIRVTSNSPVSGNSGVRLSAKKNSGLIAGITVPIIAICVLLLVLAWRRKKKETLEYDDYELIDLPNRPNSFSYGELRTATEDFNLSKKLGEGGFGKVFKGTLSDGKEVAVKQLTKSPQGKRQFAAEVATISSVQHRNLVKLYGCCYEGNNRLLVFEYLPNRSLDLFLFGNNNVHLDWPARFSICLGIARGLAYLHEESSVRIVHRDIKASNILLDNDLSPKIADFGLAKLYDESKTHVTTGVAGTAGYLAPEYAMRGQLTEKADVFAFGVLALEIISGKQNTESCIGMEKVYLMEWAWHLHEEKRDLDMINPTLTSYNPAEASRLIGVAFMCTQSSPARRPAMSRVVAMLVGDMEVTPVTTRPSYLMDWHSIKAGNSLEAPTSKSTNLAVSSGMDSLIRPAESIDEGR